MSEREIKRIYSDQLADYLSCFTPFHYFFYFLFFIFGWNISTLLGRLLLLHSLVSLALLTQLTHPLLGPTYSNESPWARPGPSPCNCKCFYKRTESRKLFFFNSQKSRGSHQYETVAVYGVSYNLGAPLGK